MSCLFRLVTASFALGCFVPRASEAAEEVYFAVNEDDAATLTVAGITDGTTWRVMDLVGGADVAEGVVNRFEAEAVSLAKLRRIALVTSEPVLAYAGFDCCGLGATSFVPTASGHARVGRQFVLYFPVLRADALRIFAMPGRKGDEDVSIRIQEESGACVVDRRLARGEVWTPWGLVARRFYTLVASGEVLVQQNAATGVESVPPFDRLGSCDRDVSSSASFTFATHSGSTGAAALLSYSGLVSASLYGVRSGELEWTSDGTDLLEEGTFAYIQGLGLGEHRFEYEGGAVAVWAGDTEGGVGIEWMGDDQSQHVGWERADERVVWAHGQTHGGAVFSGPEGAAVSVDGEGQDLGPFGYVDLAPGALHQVVANRPVVVAVRGGNEPDDWGTFLRPLPRAGETCEDVDVGAPECPTADLDAGPDVDAGVDAGDPIDAGQDGGGGPGADAGSDAGGTVGIDAGAAGGTGCGGCRTTLRAAPAVGSALGVGALFGFALVVTPRRRSGCHLRGKPPILRRHATRLARGRAGSGHPLHSLGQRGLR